MALPTFTPSHRRYDAYSSSTPHTPTSYWPNQAEVFGRSGPLPRGSSLSTTAVKWPSRGSVAQCDRWRDGRTELHLPTSPLDGKGCFQQIGPPLRLVELGVDRIALDVTIIRKSAQRVWNLAPADVHGLGK